MSGNSTAAGYLTPFDAPAPIEEDALDQFFHDVIAGITGVDGKLVRPRWQEVPLNMPPANSSWIAFGVTNQIEDFNGYVEHAEGKDTLQRYETLDLMVSSYGPKAATNLGRLLDGLEIEQNRAVLTANGMGVLEATDKVNAPVLVKDRWRKRIDSTIKIRREIRREYDIRDIASALVTLDVEKFKTTIAVNPPAP